MDKLNYCLNVQSYEIRKLKLKELNARWKYIKMVQPIYITNFNIWVKENSTRNEPNEQNVSNNEQELKQQQEQQQKQIDSLFRKIVLLCHPDKNLLNQTESQALFQFVLERKQANDAPTLEKMLNILKIAQQQAKMNNKYLWILQEIKIIVLENNIEKVTNTYAWLFYEGNDSEKQLVVNYYTDDLVERIKKTLIQKNLDLNKKLKEEEELNKMLEEMFKTEEEI